MSDEPELSIQFDKLKFVDIPAKSHPLPFVDLVCGARA